MKNCGIFVAKSSEKWYSNRKLYGTGRLIGHHGDRNYTSIQLTGTNRRKREYAYETRAYLKRAMAVLLALVMTLSLVTPSWAAGRSTVATKGENNGITWEKVDNIKLPIKENAAVEEEAQ